MRLYGFFPKTLDFFLYGFWIAKAPDFGASARATLRRVFIFYDFLTKIF